MLPSFQAHHHDQQVGMLQPIGFGVLKYVVRKKFITFKSYLKGIQIASSPLRKKIGKK
jgi:hypothetical protein